MMYEIKMKILFKVREIAWVLVSELENILYPYNNRLTPEEQYEHEMRDPITGEIEIVESEISLIPETSVSTDLETSLKIYKLLEALEDLDDTQNVHSNADFPEEIIEHLN